MSFLPEEEKVQVGHHHSIPVLKSSYKEDGGSLFTSSHMKKTRGNKYKLYMFHNNIRKTFFTEEQSFTGTTSPVTW